MKKLRGFRFGRNIIRIWRCLRRQHGYRRSKRSGYIRLHSSLKLEQQQPKPSVTGRVLTWGRLLSQHLRHFHDDKNRLLPNSDHAAKPPKGHLAVYVGGEEIQKFIVPVVYFNHPLFGELLREAEEVYGFHHPGGITIPCPVSYFEKVRTRVEACSEFVGGGSRLRSERMLPWF